MPVACILIEHFLFKAEVLRVPLLQKQSIIIYRSIGTNNYVADYSPNLRHIQVGMPIREALALASTARTLEADFPYYIDTCHQILVKLLERSPSIENSGLGETYVSLNGLDHLYESDASLVTSLSNAVPNQFGAQIGISDNKFTAYLAAHIARPGGAFKAPYDKKLFASIFPIDYLLINPEIKERLRFFGMENLTDVASTSIGTLQSQFGITGKLLWELSNGIDERPIIPIYQQEIISESLTFTFGMASMPMLLFTIRSLLRQAFGRPEMRGRFVWKVTIECTLVNKPAWSRTFQFKEGLGNANKVMFALESRWEAGTPSGAVDSLCLMLSDFTGELSTQPSLISDVRNNTKRLFEEMDAHLRSQKRGSLYRIVSVDPKHPLPEMREMQVPVDPLSMNKIKSIKIPIAIKIIGDFLPNTIYVNNLRLSVSCIEDLWRVNLWWLANPVDRTYMRLIVDGSKTTTVFRDNNTGNWFQQNYS
jgi:nucleotidyltransferase/DNA polymerase involved in DNA repair